MPKAQTTVNTSKRKTTASVSHILLQNGDDLFLGSWGQLEHADKENLKVGMTAILNEGRKRLCGTILCIGTSAQCEQTKKSMCQPLKNTSDRLNCSTAPADMSGENGPTNSSRKDRRQNHDSQIIAVEKGAKLVLTQQPKGTAKTNINNNKSSKSKEIGKQPTANCYETDEEIALVIDETCDNTDFDLKQTNQKISRVMENRESVAVKKKPANKSNTELCQKALPTASTKPKSNTPMSIEIPREEEDETEGEEEQREEQDERGEEVERTGDAIGKNLFDDEPAQQSKTNKRKNPGEDAIGNGGTKCHTKLGRDKSQQLSNGSVSTQVKKKRGSGPTLSNVIREVEFLKNQLDNLKRSTFAVPTGDAAAFILTLSEHIRSNGTLHQGISDPEKLDIGERLADISETLGLSEADLDEVRHQTDITKTVRQVTKLVYPTINVRQKMKISNMDRKVLQAIIDYARIYHPFAPKTIDLRGHIGNVFASDRKKANGPSAVHRSTAETEEEIGGEESMDDDEESNNTDASDV